MRQLAWILIVLGLVGLLRAAGNDELQIIRDVPYVTNGDAAQKLDLYLPKGTPSKPLPLIVHIHGGGWLGGKKDNPPLQALVPDGYVLASIEYRFSNVAKFPAQIQDCQAAVRFLRAHAAEYHIDPDHVGGIGGSAGGHLVSLLGTAGGKDAFPKIGGNEDQSDRLQAVVDLFGPANFATVMQQAADDGRVRNGYHFNEGDPYSTLIGRPLGSDPKLDSAVSPIHYVSSDNPPFLILHGQMDAQVPYAQSEEFLAALQKTKVPAMLQPFPVAGHGGPAFKLPAVQTLIHQFLDHTLKGTGEMPQPLPTEMITPPKP